MWPIGGLFYCLLFDPYKEIEHGLQGFMGWHKLKLGADHLTLDGAGGRGWFWKTNFLQALVGKKNNCVQPDVIESLWEKTGKKYPAHQIAIKKILADQKSPTPPLKS